MAIASPNFERIYAEVGTNRSAGKKVRYGKKVDSLTQWKLFHISEYFFIFTGVDAFALKPYLIKPYPQQNLTTERRVHNYTFFIYKKV